MNGLVLKRRIQIQDREIRNKLSNRKDLMKKNNNNNNMSNNQEAMVINNKTKDQIQGQSNKKKNRKLKRQWIN